MSVFAKLFEILVEKHLSQLLVFLLIRDATLFGIPSKTPLDSALCKHVRFRASLRNLSYWTDFPNQKVMCQVTRTLV